MFLMKLNKATLTDIISNRALQIVLLCFISMLFCQVLKFIIISIKNRSIEWPVLFSTGGFPSSHTSTCVTLVVSLFLFQLHDLNGRLDWSFAVSVVFTSISIHDAMGVRLEASKHAKILNHITSDIPDEEKKKIGFGKKDTLKEMLGHKGIEVLGGVALGLIVGIIGYLCLVNII